MQQHEHSLELSLSIALAFLLLPITVHARTRTIGIGGGFAERGVVTTTKYYDRIYKDRTDGVAFVTLDAVRGSSGHLRIAGHVAYLPYGDAFSQAHHLPVAVGLRYLPWVGLEHKGSPYIELSPAIVWSKWKTSLFSAYENSSIHPGMIASLGAEGSIAGRIGLDLGLRYFLSADANGQVKYTSSQTLKGLRQAGVFVGLNYSL